MLKRIGASVICAGLLLVGTLVLGNIHDHETVAKNNESTSLESSQPSFHIKKQGHPNDKKSLVDPDDPNQKFIYISPEDEAPPEVANAYTTKEGGAQSLPNADPDTPIVLMQLPHHKSANPQNQ
jgi:hypothetical protein